MPKFTICIIGKIASGKSTIAKCLKEIFTIPIASFGRYLTRYSETNLLSTERESLQDLGLRFIKEDPEYFLREVISYNCQDAEVIIIEGIRHNVIFDLIKKLSRHTLFVFIEASREVRYQRFLGREKEGENTLTFERFCINDEHEVEQEIDLLKGRCKVVVDTDFLSVKNVVDLIMSDISRCIKDNNKQ